MWSITRREISEIGAPNSTFALGKLQRSPRPPAVFEGAYFQREGEEKRKGRGRNDKDEGEKGMGGREEEREVMEFPPFQSYFDRGPPTFKNLAPSLATTISDRCLRRQRLQQDEPRDAHATRSTLGVYRSKSCGNFPALTLPTTAHPRSLAWPGRTALPLEIGGRM